MKQQIEQLIDHLADKSLTRGCQTSAGLWLGDTEDANGKRIFTDATIRWNETESDHETMKVAFALIPVEKVKILGHPILIGDVLAKLEAMIRGKFGDAQLATSYSSISGTMQYQWEYWFGTESSKLVKSWGECGFTKSLQAIFAECEWETCWCGELQGKGKHSKNCVEKRASTVVPKQKAHRELFEILIQLGL